MLQWLSENAGTIIISALLILMVAFLVRGLIRDKKAGRPICSGGCAGCSGCCPGCFQGGKKK